jgi:aspartyl-tRNA(Asn)/glutamyl-tRNA(Gln) amidotransferase subunit A
VKANLCAFATGTDTGGSIRQPASFCGITGIKPTYGRVSRWGMIAFASSLDQAGVFTKTALDAAVALEMISGFDKKDSTSIDSEVSNLKYETVSEMDHIIGIPSDIIDSIKDPKVKETYLENIDLLKKKKMVLKLKKLNSKILNILFLHTTLLLQQSVLQTYLDTMGLNLVIVAKILKI